MGLSPLRALLPAAVASALWYVFLIEAGVALGKSLPAVRALVDDANHVLSLIALAVTAALAVWLWRRARRPAAVLALALGASARLDAYDRPDASSGGLDQGPRPAGGAYLRVNQVGYRPCDPKLALALTDRDLGRARPSR